MGLLRALAVLKKIYTAPSVWRARQTQPRMKSNAKAKFGKYVFAPIGKRQNFGHHRTKILATWDTYLFGCTRKRPKIERRGFGGKMQT